MALQSQQSREIGARTIEPFSAGSSMCAMMTRRDVMGMSSRASLGLVPTDRSRTRVSRCDGRKRVGERDRGSRSNSPRDGAPRSRDSAGRGQKIKRPEAHLFSLWPGPSRLRRRRAEHPKRKAARCEPPRGPRHPRHKAGELSSGVERIHRGWYKASGHENTREAVDRTPACDTEVLHAGPRGHLQPALVAAAHVSQAGVRARTGRGSDTAR